LKDALGCGNCGTRIESIDGNQKTLNQIEFEQKGDSKKFKAIFSDNVGHDLVSTFGGMIGIQLPKGKHGTTQFSRIAIDNHNNREKNQIDQDDNDLLVEALNKVFKIDGDKLILQTANLKCKTGLDKAIRVSLLTILGCKYLLNLEDTKRSMITDMLNRAKLNLGSFRAWIGRSEEIGKKGGGLVFLTTNGLPVAIQVLNEIIDPDIIEGSISFSKNNGAKRKNKGNAEGGAEPNKKSSKSPKEYLTKLIEENFFDTKRTLSDIVKHLKDNHAVIIETSDISGHMGKLVGSKQLKRIKGESKIYEYFI